MVTRRGARTWLRLAFRQWLFLAVCQAAGSGLVTNLVFKDHWGGARPKQVVHAMMFVRPAGRRARSA
jgi:lipid A 4'-phosphatase